MSKPLANLWAKTAKDGGQGWHPLILHLLDVAASADAILAREQDCTGDAASGEGLPDFGDRADHEES